MAFLASILAQSDTNLLYWVVGAVLLVVLVLVILLLKFVNLWIQAQLSKAPVSIFLLIGMSLRKVNPTVIVRAMISSIQAGIPISVRELEAHYLAGGNVMRVVSALIAADRANLGLDFRRAAAIDLAGRDVLEAVQTSVNPRVIDCPVQGKIAAMAKDGIQVLAARASRSAPTSSAWSVVRRRRRSSRASARASSRAIGSSNTHKDVLENPDSISRTVLHKGLDAGTAFEILSIDIADVDIGENIGSRLQADQAEADKRVAQAKAEERRAMAVAQEQEQSAQVMANRALFVLAEADVPKAMADALRSGRLGVMDYMKIQNVGADTRMRSEIASAEQKQTGRPEIGGEPR
jgi:uncharacterized protein YqfA (UPF0365 family)